MTDAKEFEGVFGSLSPENFRRTEAFKTYVVAPPFGKSAIMDILNVQSDVCIKVGFYEESVFKIDGYNSIESIFEKMSENLEVFIKINEGIYIYLEYWEDLAIFFISNKNKLFSSVFENKYKYDTEKYLEGHVENGTFEKEYILHLIYLNSPS